MRAAILVHQSLIAGIAALLCAAGWLGACTDIEKCKLGTEGCICTANRACDQGLRCTVDDYCVSKGSGGSGGSSGRCEDTCASKKDGICDDGGQDSVTSLCQWGTDCSDCGRRSGTLTELRLCTDTCRKARDGTCDDGGKGSVFGTVCKLGTDCTDCGPRMSGPSPSELCTDTCKSAGDGICDDGDSDAVYDSCDWGTDCNDCGPRSGDPP